jgi:hypothetical protein
MGTATSAFCQGKTDVRSRVVDSADITRALGDDAKLMVWGDAVWSGCIVVALGEGMLCEGLKRVYRTTSMVPKAMPFD